MATVVTPSSINTYSNQLVFGTRGEVAAIRTETNAANVEIGAHIRGVVIFKHANLFTGLNIENLSGSVAASCNVFAVMTESNTANDTFVVERVDKVDIKDSLHLRIEDGVPILASLLVVGSHSINLKVAKCVSHSRCMRPAHSTVVGSRVANLRRSRTSRGEEEGQEGQEDLGPSGAEVPGAALEEGRGPAAIVAAAGHLGVGPAGSAAGPVEGGQDHPDCHQP
ncbi:hypothetical protein HG530_005881 [Fusarium avenaceum]|nr:hypothetical protein HG530_005881 [Fusarium avenaceum]